MAEARRISTLALSQLPDEDCCSLLLPRRVETRARVADLHKIEVPMLVIHGDDDHVLPYAKTGARLAGLISNVQTVVIAGGPHAIAWTHADQVNNALLKFLA